MLSRSVYSVALWWRKIPIFAVFGLQHLVVSPTGSSLRKLNTGAQLQTFPYPTVSKSFCTRTPSWRNWAHSLWRSKAWRTDKETNRQKLNVFSRPGGGWNPNPTKLGMVIGPRARSYTSKTFGVWRTVSPLGGAENLGGTRPLQLKTPITPQPLEQIQRNFKS